MDNKDIMMVVNNWHLTTTVLYQWDILRRCILRRCILLASSLNLAGLIQGLFQQSLHQPWLIHSLIHLQIILSLKHQTQ